MGLATLAWTDSGRTSMLLCECQGATTQSGVKTAGIMRELTAAEDRSPR
jgi:hypothetical protein